MQTITYDLLGVVEQVDQLLTHGVEVLRQQGYVLARHQRAGRQDARLDRPEVDQIGKINNLRRNK
jgi:hypothetical protein